MIYRVVVDGANFYDETLDRTLINPSVDVELNSAGSFDFTIPPNHDLYSSIHLLTSDVEVYEDGDIIFFGRPIEIKTDFYNQKHVHCEGGLAYFNDSIVGPTTLDSVTGRTVEYENVSIKEIFRKIVDSHNRQVPANRQFTVGRIEVADKLVYRLFNYETCKDALSKFCLETTGGYLQTRRVAGVNYIDWLRVLDNNPSDQPVRYALNITDIEQKLDGADIKTGIIPLGAEIDGVKLNIQTVNAGSDRLLSDAAQTYGEILQVVEFSDITTAQELKEKGLEWLADEQFEGLSVEVNAAELSYLDESYHHFQVGQTVHCVSNPHLLDKNFPITKLSLSLDSAVKTLTIGTQKKQKLTEIYKAADGSVYTASSSYNGSGGSSAGGSSIGSTSLSGSAGGGSSSGGSSYDDTQLRTLINSKSTVVANPQGTPTATLSKVKIDDDIFRLPISGGSGGTTVIANPVSDGSIIDDILSKFNVCLKDQQSPSASISSDGKLNFNVNDYVNYWSQSVTFYNNVAIDVTNYNSLRITLDITEQADNGYFWVTLSQTKYVWNDSTWPGCYINEDSLIRLSESGTYDVDVSSYTGDHYIYIGSTSGKTALTKGGCTNNVEGKIVGSVTAVEAVVSTGTGIIEPVPATEVLNTIDIGGTVYEILGGSGNGSGNPGESISIDGYSATVLYDGNGNPSLGTIALSDSVLNYDAIYVEGEFNGEALMGNILSKETFDTALGNLYIGLVTFSNAYIGLTLSSTETSFVLYGGGGANGVTRVYGLSYGDGGVINGSGGNNSGAIVHCTKTEYDALPNTKNNDGVAYFVEPDVFAEPTLDPDYTYHTNQAGTITVRVYHKGESDQETVWFFHGWAQTSGDMVIPQELASYAPSDTSHVFHSKNYTNASGTTQSGWIGFYNNYIRAWTQDRTALTTGTMYGVVDISSTSIAEPQVNEYTEPQVYLEQDPASIIMNGVVYATSTGVAKIKNQFDKTLLYQNQNASNENTITLTDDFDNYDELRIVITENSSDIWYPEQVISKEMLEDALSTSGRVVVLYFFSNSYYAYATVGSKTSLAISSQAGAFHVAEIYGVKY